ncbi:MAG: hypothetical protein HC771_14020 [Synechococcales cyanobacterium CRU_2_2]|nr:hypothetical protein [Synechococcales cyanobacterium CRU_2_2]
MILTERLSFPSLTTLRPCLIVGFFPLVALVLGADSRWFAATNWGLAGWGGQAIANVLAALFFLVLLGGLDFQERLMALIFVPFSALAEYLFSPVWEVYLYRLEAVPLYVPLGHAILFSTGLMLSKLKKLEDWPPLQSVLLGLLALLFGGAILFLHDAFSALLGGLFALVLNWRGCRLVYPIMAFLVLYIELLGTGLGCWTWEAKAFGILPTTNPPLGAFVFYVFGDIAVLKLVRMLGRDR